MSVKIEPSGRRCTVVETEVPGTPEQVWAAIATGPGISSWFMPTRLEGRVGGEKVVSFGPGMDSASTITEWDAPRRFVVDGAPMGPGGPALAFEWTVEARQGGTCVVRVVNSLFAEGDDWDDQLTGLESGWPGFFRVLDLYLRHFQGQPSSMFFAMQGGAGEEDEVWRRLKAALGLENAEVGEVRRGPEGVPAFAGTVEANSIGSVKKVILMRLAEPVPGIATFAVHKMGAAQAAVTYYLYGERAVEEAARSEAAWKEWLTAFSAGGTGRA